MIEGALPAHLMAVIEKPPILSPSLIQQTSSENALYARKILGVGDTVLNIETGIFPFPTKTSLLSRREQETQKAYGEQKSQRSNVGVRC